MASLAIAPAMAASVVVASRVGGSSVVFSSSSSVSMVSISSVASLRMSRGARVVAMATTPERTKLVDQIEKSVKEAQETCAADETSGECVAAWDEVEELSAARSHQKDAAKASLDALEVYCVDNPETDECRVYDS